MSPSEPSLGELEHVVLLAVMQLGDDAYGVPILELIHRRAGRSLSRGALYTVLERLETKGALRSRHGEAVAERGGRPRRYYQVTARGLAAARRARASLLALWQGLEADLQGRP